MNKLPLLIGALVAGGAIAAEFTTDGVPGQSTLKIEDQSIANAINMSDTTYCSVGRQNSLYNMNAFLWAGLPDRYATGARIVCPVALRGKMPDANMDIWYLGFQTTPTRPTAQADYASVHVFADEPGMRAKSDGSYFMLNGRMPVKLVDDAIASGEYVDWGKGQFIGTREFAPASLMTQIGLAFNRGATTNGYMMLRFNPDSLDPGGEFRFAGYKTATAAATSGIAAMHVTYAAEDDLPTVAPQLSAAEQASDEYVKSTVSWVQYRDSDGTSGFEYPAWCGVRDGKSRDLLFAFDAPTYTLTNAWLTLTVLPPFSNAAPAGAMVSLSLLGFVDAPAANTDLVITNQLEGQTPVVLQDCLPIRSLVAGQNIFTFGHGQRDLIRALNARAKAAALARSGREGKMAVLRLSVTSPTETDWSFAIGSVATPRVESFFEGVEYRKEIALFANSGFEDGLTGWSVTSPKTYTANQVSVVADPTDASNHCLRLSNCDGLADRIELIAENADTASLNRYLGYPARITYRVYVDADHPFVRRGSSLTEFGYFLWLYYAKAGGSSQYVTGRIADDATTCGKWIATINESKAFPLVDQGSERFYLQYRFDTTIDKDSGVVFYVDDVQLYVEDFYDYPDEKKGFAIILR